MTEPESAPLTMSRPKTIWRDISGIVVLDKPKGMSSNTALQRVRHIYRARKAGHTGSLDPLASGQLPICLGEAAKVAGYLLESNKTYVATLRLGELTSTGDVEGEVLQECAVPTLTEAHIENVLATLLGIHQQVPPMYSALKHQGQPLYKLARQGIAVERQPRQIEIFAIELISWASPYLVFEVTCSKGTYVRTLGEELAQRLNCLGHLSDLRRTRIGQRDWVAHTLAELESLRGDELSLDGFLYPTDSGVSDWPSIVLTDSQSRCLAYGLTLTDMSLTPQSRYRLYWRDLFLGLGVADASATHLAVQRLMADSVQQVLAGYSGGTGAVRNGDSSSSAIDIAVADRTPLTVNKKLFES